MPKQLKEHGLSAEQVRFEREGIEAIVDFYTREAGVRNLEREIAAVCRDITVKLAEGRTIQGLAVTAELVRELLGPEHYHPEIAERRLSPGVAVGLSFSSSGGDLMIVEATKMPGKGEIFITGSMRNVMKESAATAVSFVRSRADRLGLDPEWLKAIDLHLHVPRGGHARDAAYAGLPMFVAVASLLLRAPCRPDVAVTGEITLRGNVLPVPGLKDKILAAHRAGVRKVIVPAKNRVEVEEVPAEERNDMDITLLNRVDEVLPLVLAEPDPGDDSEDQQLTPAPSGEVRA